MSKTTEQKNRQKRYEASIKNVTHAIFLTLSLGKAAGKDLDAVEQALIAGVTLCRREVIT